MGDKAFADSNVLLYLLSAYAAKADRAEAVLAARPVISVQVLNEVTHVCRRKLRLPWQAIDELLTSVRALCEVVPLTEATHDRARQLAERYQLSFYDAAIAAAALLAGCTRLCSEDFQHGLLMDGSLRVHNPFMPA